jgi:hypothetical protein
MIVVAFNGSDRKKGNPLILIHPIVAGLHEGGEIELIQLDLNNLLGRFSRYTCLENKHRRCVAGE